MPIYLDVEVMDHVVRLHVIGPGLGIVCEGDSCGAGCHEPGDEMRFCVAGGRAMYDGDEDVERDEPEPPEDDDYAEEGPDYDSDDADDCDCDVCMEERRKIEGY